MANAVLLPPAPVPDGVDAELGKLAPNAPPKPGVGVFAPPPGIPPPPNIIEMRKGLAAPPVGCGRSPPPPSVDNPPPKPPLLLPSIELVASKGDEV